MFLIIIIGQLSAVFPWIHVVFDSQNRFTSSAELNSVLLGKIIHDRKEAAEMDY
jgi:hypothetical protein